MKGLVALVVVLLSVVECSLGEDLRQKVFTGAVPCIQYDISSLSFFMNCTITWFDHFNTIHFISLEANETFDGNGFAVDWGTQSTEGIFKSSVDFLSSFNEAPLIRNFHTTGGKTASKGSFIVRESQNYFRVDSCSSSGAIEGDGSGGICGAMSGTNGGRVEISNCTSTGKISTRCGGIAGEKAAYLGGFLSIDTSSSIGDIGSKSGGVVGARAGSHGGMLHVARSHSSGKVDKYAGGIIGYEAGHGSGSVFVQQCYSLGQVDGNHAGGIVGAVAASLDGFVTVQDCYTQGSIVTSAGGIFGREAGGDGLVEIFNSFAKGEGTTAGILAGISVSTRLLTVSNCVYKNLVGIGTQAPLGNVVQTGNSNNWGDIEEQLLRNESGALLWSNKVWIANATANGYPKLRFEVEGKWPTLELSWDLRPSIIRKEINCIEYLPETREFQLQCDLAWGNNWTPAHFVTLKPGETFHGMGHQIDVSTVPISYGLFRVDSVGITSIDAAVPTYIHEVHVKGSLTAYAGGFIVRSQQRLFSVSSCSSSGDATGPYSGGICGSSSIRPQLPIVVSDSFFVGKIYGEFAGGIIGGDTAGIVDMNNCYSMGTIGGNNAGGVIGGDTRGVVNIKRCYSIGAIGGDKAGGIIGSSAGNNVSISQSYSTGSILGSAGGGICGASAAQSEGRVWIANCFSSGNIRGAGCGGILGGKTGTSFGVVQIRNVYASGSLMNTSAGGLIGSIDQTAGRVQVENSVYSPPIVGGSTSDLYGMGNSASFDVINGTLFNNANVSWPSDIWTVAASSQFPILRFQLQTPSPSPMAAVTHSPLPSASSPPFDVQPEIIDIEVVRTRFTSSNISQPIWVTADIGTTIEWRTSSVFADSLISLPDSELFPPEKAKSYVERNIVLHIHLFSKGNTELDAFAVFRQPTNNQETSVRVKLNISIVQGDPAIKSSSTKVETSMQEGAKSESIEIVNFGSHRVLWNTTLYIEDEGESELNPWLTAPEEGVVTGNNHTDIELRFFPQNTGGVGAYRAWMLVDTDAWENNYPQEKGDMPPDSTIARAEVPSDVVHFWVQIRLTVSSVFVCPQQSQLTLPPFETKETQLTIVNTNEKQVGVSFSNFILEYVGASRIISTDSSTQESLQLSWSVLWNDTIHLSPWMSLSPSTMVLKRGVSKNIKLQVGYFGPTLPVLRQNETTKESILPGDYELTFDSNFFSGGDTSQPSFGSMSHTIGFQNVPGVPNADTSTLLASKADALVEEELRASIRLRDEFGYEPASAVFSRTVDSDSTAQMKRRNLPVLRVAMQHVSGKPQPKINFIPRLQEFDLVSTVSLSTSARVPGLYTLDVTIDGDSINGSPQNISIETVICPEEHETLDDSGTDCICQPGCYRGVNSTCTECSAGTYQPVANNESSCIGCPRSTFSALGSPTCHPCPNEGVTCLDGQLKMEEGVWCELCVSENGTFSTFVQKPHLLFDVVFHECEPESSCSVDTDGFAVSCTEGYTGPVCRRCTSGYAREQNGPCVPCGDVAQDKLIVALSGLVLLGVVGFLSLKSHKDIQTLSASSEISKSSDDELHSEVKAFHHAILLVLDYLQICAILSTMEINPFEDISSGFTELTSMGTMSPARASAFQCITNASPVQTTLTILASPIVVALAAFAIQALVEYAFIRRERLSFPTATWLHSSAVSIVQLLNLLHMSVTDATLRIFNMYEHEIGSSKRASLDLTIEIGSEKYRRLQIAGILSLGLFVVGYPLFVGTYFARRYARISSSAAAYQFSRMTGGYRTERYGFLWDIVIILRKVGLLIVAVWSTSAVEQFIWLTVILIVSFAIVLIISPYKSEPVLTLQVLMIFLSCVNGFLGMQLEVTDPWESEVSRAYTTLFPGTIKHLVIVVQVLFFAAAAIVWLYISPGAARAARTLVLGRCRSLFNKFCSHKHTENSDPALRKDIGRHARDSVCESQPNPLLSHGNAVALADSSKQKDDNKTHHQSATIIEQRILYGNESSKRDESQRNLRENQETDKTNHHPATITEQRVLYGNESSLAKLDASQKNLKDNPLYSSRTSTSRRRFGLAKPSSSRRRIYRKYR